MKMHAPRPGWGVPGIFELSVFDPSYGYLVACSWCQKFVFAPFADCVQALVERGILAHSCPGCERSLVTEIAPFWFEHNTPYPQWLVDLLAREGITAVP